MGQRLSKAPALGTDVRSLWFPPSLPLPFPWWRQLCRMNLICHLPASSLSGLTCWISCSVHIISLRAYMTVSPSLSMCLPCSHHQSGWQNQVWTWRQSHQHLSPWVRTACASCHTRCEWPAGWVHFECMRFSILFSLVAGQVCQYFWQPVYNIMVFLLGEESKKSSFLLLVWGQGVYLLLDVIQWIHCLPAQRGNCREETV